MIRLHAALCGSLLLSLVAAPAVSSAETLADQSVATSETEKALALTSAGKHTEALPHYELAYKAWATPMTSFRLAEAYERVQRLLEAAQMYRKTVELEDSAKSDVAKNAVVSARARIPDLEKSIPTIVVKVEDAPAGATVRVAGRAVLPDQETQVNPGAIVVTLSVPGKPDVEKTLDVAAGTKGTIVTLKAAAASGVDAPSVPKPFTAVVDDRTEPPSSATRTVLVYGGFGLAGAGIVVGSIFGLSAMSKKSSLESACPSGTCPPDQRGQVDAYDRAGTLSTLSFAAAGVGVVLGVVGLVIPREGPKATATATMTVTPWVGVGSAGILAVFR